MAERGFIAVLPLASQAAHEHLRDGIRRKPRRRVQATLAKPQDDKAETVWLCRIGCHVAQVLLRGTFLVPGNELEGSDGVRPPRRLVLISSSDMVAERLALFDP